MMKQKSTTTKALLCQAIQPVQDALRIRSTSPQAEKKTEYEQQKKKKNAIKREEERCLINELNQMYQTQIQEIELSEEKNGVRDMMKKLKEICIEAKAADRCQRLLQGKLKIIGLPRFEGRWWLHHPETLEDEEVKDWFFRQPNFARGSDSLLKKILILKRLIEKKHDTFKSRKEKEALEEEEESSKYQKEKQKLLEEDKLNFKDAFDELNEQFGNRHTHRNLYFVRQEKSEKGVSYCDIRYAPVDSINKKIVQDFWEDKMQHEMKFVILNELDKNEEDNSVDIIRDCFKLDIQYESQVVTDRILMKIPLGVHVEQPNFTDFLPIYFPQQKKKMPFLRPTYLTKLPIEDAYLCEFQQERRELVKMFFKQIMENGKCQLLKDLNDFYQDYNLNSLYENENDTQ